MPSALTRLLADARVHLCLLVVAFGLSPRLTALAAAVRQADESPWSAHVHACRRVGCGACGLIWRLFPDPG